MDDRSPEQAARGVRPSTSGSELAVVGGLVALGAASLLPPGHVDDGPVLCPFRLVSGLPCPACGLTRSWVHLTHGNLTESWAMNPFGVVLVVGLALLVVLVVRARVRDAAPPRLESLLLTPAVLAVAVAWAVFGVVRMTA